MFSKVKVIPAQKELKKYLSYSFFFFFALFWALEPSTSYLHQSSFIFDIISARYGCAWFLNLRPGNIGLLKREICWNWLNPGLESWDSVLDNVYIAWERPALPHHQPVQPPPQLEPLACCWLFSLVPGSGTNSELRQGRVTEFSVRVSYPWLLLGERGARIWYWYLGQRLHFIIICDSDGSWHFPGPSEIWLNLFPTIMYVAWQQTQFPYIF